MPLANVTKFEHLFRSAASVNVDKNDLKRYREFVNQKMYDLLIIGQGTAKANGRDILEARDLPVAKGLQECTDAFRRMDTEIGLGPTRDSLVMRPPLEVVLSEASATRLPVIAGGLSVALGRTFKIIDPSLKRPMREEWEQAFRIFDLLV